MSNIYNLSSVFVLAGKSFSSDDIWYKVAFISFHPPVVYLYISFLTFPGNSPLLLYFMVHFMDMLNLNKRGSSHVSKDLVSEKKKAGGHVGGRVWVAGCVSVRPRASIL